MKKEVITFGCRLNSFESEIINNNLSVSDLNNVAVFNTCSVTKEAERQAKQYIRKYIRENPDSKIIITGCAAQINPESYYKMEGVDKVIGNDEKLNPETYSKNLFNIDTEKVLVNDIMSVKENAPHLISSMQEKARAFIEVQNGCNHRCTFCIIPYGRGNSRSVAIGDIVKQGQILVENGYNELVLTAVDMTSYGEDLPGNPSLGEMVKRFLNLVPNLKRLRLSSIDVAEIDDILLDLIINEKRLMPHLHLSLQAGDDMILKRMKRRHTRQQAIDFCKDVKSKRSDIVFGADIIAGFPTETDEMFENSIAMIEEISIPHLHVFPYSKREGTPVANIPDEKHIPKQIKKNRAEKYRNLANEQLKELQKSISGTVQNIVIENNKIGRTEQFLQIKLKNNYTVGDVIECKIEYNADRLVEISK